MDVTRLEKLVGMLGSAHDGEKANAASFIQKMATENKMTVVELMKHAFGGGSRSSYSGGSSRGSSSYGNPFEEALKRAAEREWGRRNRHQEETRRQEEKARRHSRAWGSGSGNFSEDYQEDMDDRFSQARRNDSRHRSKEQFANAPVDGINILSDLRAAYSFGAKFMTRWEREFCENVVPRWADEDLSQAQIASALKIIKKAKTHLKYEMQGGDPNL